MLPLAAGLQDGTRAKLHANLKLDWLDSLAKPGGQATGIAGGGGGAGMVIHLVS